MDVQREVTNLWAGELRPALLTVKEAARVLNLGRSTVYQLIADGRLDAVHIGRSTRVPVDAITKFIRALGPAELTSAAQGQAVTRRA